MKRLLWRVCTLLMLAVLTLMLPGCWDARELDTLSIVAGVGIDTAKDAGQYDFTVQVGIAQKSGEKDGGGGQDEPSMMMTATDSTLLLAFEQLRLKSSRELFLHPNQVVVIGKDLAKQGIQPILDMFLRYHESRLQVWVLVADTTAKELLNTKTQQEPITAVAISRILDDQAGISKYYSTNMIEFTSRLIAKGTSSIVPLIASQGEEDNQRLALVGSALFNEDKMVGELNEEETLGYVMAMGEMEDGIIQVPMEEGTAVLHITSLDSNAKPRLSNGAVTIDLKISAVFAIGELQGFAGVKMDDLFPKIQKAALQTVMDSIGKTFKKTQQLKTDIFGYGISVYQNYPKEWRTMKDNWDEIYPNITLNITAKGQITNTGKINDSLNMKGSQ